MAKTTLERSISKLTVRELRDIIRQVVREEGLGRWRTDRVAPQLTVMSVRKVRSKARNAVECRQNATLLRCVAHYERNHD